MPGRVTTHKRMPPACTYIVFKYQMWITVQRGSFEQRAFCLEIFINTAKTTILRLSGFYLGLSGWACTKKVKSKPFWISWSKRKWVAMVSSKILQTDDSYRSPQLSLINACRSVCTHHHITCKSTHLHLTHTTVLWLFVFCQGQPWYQKKHSPTHTHRGYQSSLSAFSIHLHLSDITTAIVTEGKHWLKDGWHI